jgi:glycosyltransferase involved in cell wall biosynthesis
VASAVHFEGVVLGPSGFAAEGREWLAALEEAGLEPSLHGARLGDLDAPLARDARGVLGQAAGRPRRPGGVVFHHSLIPHFLPQAGVRNVLQTVFETTELPEPWLGALAHADDVVVLTDWARDVLVRGGLPAHRVHVLPPPLRVDDFCPAPIRDDRRRPFRWLTVFDWSLRKGPDILLRAFARAFRRDEAELVIKTIPDARRPAAALQEQCDAIVRGLAEARAPAVTVVADVLDDAALARLYRAADGFVLASRGEAWGRPVHEALLMELPTVAPAAGGLAALLPDDRFGYPVAARVTPVSDAAAAEVASFGGCRWFEADVVDLAARMRQAFEDGDEARARARAGRRRVLALCDRRRIVTELGALISRR